MKPAIALSILLAGCSTLHQAPERVPVPVPVVKPCLLESDIPPPPASQMTPGTNIERLSASASADMREIEREYIPKLRALLKACAEPDK